MSEVVRFFLNIFQTTTNQAIFRVEAAVCRLFRDYLTKQGFVEIHTPKIISGGWIVWYNWRVENRPQIECGKYH